MNDLLFIFLLIIDILEFILFIYWLYLKNKTETETENKTIKITKEEIKENENWFVSLSKIQDINTIIKIENKLKNFIK